MIAVIVVEAAIAFVGLLIAVAMVRWLFDDARQEREWRTKRDADREAVSRHYREQSEFAALAAYPQVDDRLRRAWRP